MRALRAEIQLGTAGVKSGVSETKTLMASLTASMKQVGLGFATALNSGKGPLQKLRDDMAALNKQFDGIGKTTFAPGQLFAGLKSGGGLGTTLAAMKAQAKALVFPYENAVENLRLIEPKIAAAIKRVNDASRAPDAASRKQLSDAWRDLTVLNKAKAALKKDVSANEPGLAAAQALYPEINLLGKKKEQEYAARKQYIQSLKRQQVLERGTASIEATQKTGGQSMQVLQNLKAARDEAIRVRAEFAKLQTQQIRGGTLTAPEAKQNIANLTAEVNRLTQALGAAQNLFKNMGRNAAAAKWAANPPPVIPMSWLANMRARYQANAGASGGMNGILPMMAGYFGGGRMGGLGGAVGGMFGMSGWGAAIGMAIGMVMGALRKLFDFIKSGFMDLIALGSQLQNMKQLTGIGYGKGPQLIRAAEMSSLDPFAMGLEVSRMQANLTNIQKVAPTVSAALFRMGTPLEALRKMKPEDSFMAVLTAMRQTGNVYDSNAVAMALFNRHGSELRKLIINMSLAAEQVGSQGKFFRNYADELAYLDKTMTGLKWKKRGLIAGITESLMPDLLVGSGIINKLDMYQIGKGLKWVFAPIFSAFEWVALKLASLSGWTKKIKEWLHIPKADEPGKASGIGALSSFMAPFGKGPGDSWSKIGAFSAPGMMTGFATGIKGWHDRVLDRLTGIYMNTKNMGAFLLNGRTMGQFGVNATSFPGAMVNAMTMPGMMVNGQSMTGFGFKGFGGSMPAFNGQLPRAGGMDNSAIFKAIERNTRDSGGSVTTVNSPSGLWKPSY